VISANIPWEPISSMPEDRRDGRQVLLWGEGEFWVATWDPEASSGQPSVWIDARENRIRLASPNWWADLTPPE
jgi:hypothetical protein